MELDVRKLHRSGLLVPGNTLALQWTCTGDFVAAISLRVEADRVFLDHGKRGVYKAAAEWEPLSYAILLDWTLCSFGGRRVWWRCPVFGCGRRVALLHGRLVFACRRCSRVAYRSQREADEACAARRAETIRRRLGWEVGVLNNNGDKPKGMHWRTFARLQASHDAQVNRALAGMAAKLRMLRERVSGSEIKSR